MEIDSIEVVPVSIPSKPIEEENGVAPYVTSYGSWDSTTKLLVRVETTDGVVGWGETYPSPSVRVAVAIVKDVLAPEVIGRSLWEIESLHGRFQHGVNESVTVNLDPYLGGVTTAMWDALGKHLDVPVHQLLGGKCDDAIEVAYCFGILSPEESREQARWAIEEDYSTIKTKAGRDLEEDVNRLLAIADEADGELDVRVDANQAWSTEQVTRFGARLEDAGVYLQYLEQPVRIESYGNYKRLRERLRQPIGVNEDLYHPYNFHHLLREDAVDVGVIDLVFAGGIVPMKRLAGMAANADVSLSHHSANDLGIKTAAIAHAVASTPGVNLPVDTVYYSLTDDVIEEPFDLEDGEFSVPDGPGLGVTIDHDAIEQYRLSASGEGIRAADVTESEYREE